MIKYKRISADLDPDAYKCLGDVSIMLNCSKAEALRRGLGLIRYMLRERIKGNRIVIEDQRGNNRKEILTI